MNKPKKEFTINIILVTAFLAFIKMCGVNIGWFYVFLPLMLFAGIFISLYIFMAVMFVVFKDKIVITKKAK